MEYIFNERHFLPGSYDYNEVIRIFNDIPKFELFRTSEANLLKMVDFIMSITNINHIQCYKLYTDKHRLSLYFVIPYYFFNSKTVDIICDTICKELNYSHHEILPITAPEKCRLHMHFHLNENDNLDDEEVIERELTQLIQPWEDQVYQLLQRESPELLESDPQIIQKIPSHYRVRTKPASAVRDIQYLTSFQSNQDIHFEFFSFDFPKTSDLAGKSSMLLVYHQTKIDLTNILPILDNLGIHVIDQITSRFGDESSTIGYILAFRLLDKSKSKINEPNVRDRLIECLKMIFNEDLPNDPLNQLILTTNLIPNDIFILQALRNYFHQLFSSSYSLGVTNKTLASHPEFMALISQLFNAKFDPSTNKTNRLSNLITIKSKISTYIKSVENITDDQILRRYQSLCQACMRTNAYIKDTSAPLSFKFKCDDIFGLGTPVPYRETFVFDNELEGIHIRFGAVARGGLRWSNRLDDYRTEVLGLVKTQQTKNAVIIPVGSKGGFVIKTPGSPTFEDGIYQYKRFIASMLSLADNIIDGKKQQNKQLVSYDDFDPYFVVAADKGTATFSDFANNVSTESNFWLGDGFASGGQHGYDHKKVGITAKVPGNAQSFIFKPWDNTLKKILFLSWVLETCPEMSLVTACY